MKEISLESLEKDKWLDMKFVYTMPDEGIDRHNWFVIDLKENGSYCSDGMCNPFIFIDISIEETNFCNVENECSPTDGPITITTPYRMSPYYSDYSVNNLENVFSAKDIEIRSVSGDLVAANIPDHYCINGIGKVIWNGKTSGGASLTAGNYFWTMTLENDCGEIPFRMLFSYGDTHYQQPMTGILPCNNSVLTPIVCCEAEPNIFVNDKYIYGPGLIKYQAQNTISLANTTIDASAKNVIFKAGNEIIIEPNTDILPGADVEFIIESCGETINQKIWYVFGDKNDSIIVDTARCDNRINNNSKNSAIITTESEIPTNFNSLDIFVSPNPTTGKLTISLPKNENSVSMEISDMLGNIILAKQFTGQFAEADISSTPGGLYLLKIEAGGTIYTGKIVLQKE